MNPSRWPAILSCVALLSARGDDIRYGAGRSAVCIPFEAGNRHVAFQARLNGHDGMWLVLDTGAGGSVLDAKSAEALGLKAVGSYRTRGAGGFEQGSTVHGVDVALPGFELLDQTMGTLPLVPIAAQAGRPLDGILGHPLFERCVVEIDYPRRCLSLFDPASYRYSGSGVSLPLSFNENLPYVKARVQLPDGRTISGKFVIDTGASTNLILSPSTVDREAVLSSMGKTITAHARGVGGEREIRLGRVALLDLGGISLSRPVVALQPPGPGIISAKGTVGNIGGGILSRFKVIFDYSRRRMILEPGSDIALPFEADMSGLGLVSIPPEYRRLSVVHVLDGSPALQAGIEPGDEIESVDGTPAGDVGLSALRERLRLEGQDVRFELLRGNERINLTIRTRRMI